MSTILSHIIVGVIAFVAGLFSNYFASRWADKSKKRSVKKEREKIFQDLEKKMPELINEIRKDFETDSDCRVFHLLPSKSVVFNTSKPSFFYFEDEHNNLDSKINMLLDSDFIFDITETNTPKYQFTEELIKLISR